MFAVHCKGKKSLFSYMLTLPDRQILRIYLGLRVFNKLFNNKHEAWFGYSLLINKHEAWFGYSLFLANLVQICKILCSAIEIRGPKMRRLQF